MIVFLKHFDIILILFQVILQFTFSFLLLHLNYGINIFFLLYSCVRDLQVISCNSRYLQKHQQFSYVFDISLGLDIENLYRISASLLWIQCIGFQMFHFIFYSVYLSFPKAICFFHLEDRTSVLI